MQPIEVSVTVDRPIDEVFAYLDVIGNRPWLREGNERPAGEVGGQ